VMSDNRCLDLHVISFLPCQSACTTPWYQVVGWNTWNQGSLCTTVRSTVACSVKWDPAPSCTKPVDIPTVGHGRLG
jgi:hypothetical protein